MYGRPVTLSMVPLSMVGLLNVNYYAKFLSLKSELSFQHSTKLLLFYDISKCATYAAFSKP